MSDDELDELCERLVEEYDFSHLSETTCFKDGFTACREVMGKEIEKLNRVIKEMQNRIMQARYHLDQEELEGRDRGTADEKLDQALLCSDKILNGNGEKK